MEDFDLKILSENFILLDMIVDYRSVLRSQNEDFLELCVGLEKFRFYGEMRV